MLLTMLAVLIGANFYIFFRLWHLIPLFPASRPLLIGVAILLVILPFVSMGLGPLFPYSISSLMYRVGTSWLIVMIYLVVMFLVLDAMRLTGVLPLCRFMFNSWTGLGILSLVIVALMTAGNIHYHLKKRVEITIKTEKNSASGKPLKIVAISDLHLGYGIGIKEFQRWVKLINREAPDVVLIAGDIIDNSLKPLYERNYADVFGEIKTKHGVYLALGNHEYISNITKCIDYFNKIGVTVLRDKVVLVDNAFYIAGRDDKSNSKRETIAQMTDTLDKSKPLILFEHQPFHFDEVEENRVDLFFAGHTHAGQVWPISWITKAIFEVSHGYLRRGETHFYVTSGIGIWGGKFRIGSRSEYVVVNIE